ncbi:uncharacterized protein RAG0_07414 [Rhynchosporium agropyri]|uniref:Uncharacterized protein n=2 Tax=Rhynchosporium TaxID=38037 RepID=A0A1E1MTL2_RHYSE|nr:uncharacterized protein RAG0_07414 [Rhynchosporium agropyri]CZT52411.1 uncharacterized protein RSE6_13746 [Rhynchosporium secalis]
MEHRIGFQRRAAFLLDRDYNYGNAFMRLYLAETYVTMNKI